MHTPSFHRCVQAVVYDALQSSSNQSLPRLAASTRNLQSLFHDAQIRAEECVRTRDRLPGKEDGQKPMIVTARLSFYGARVGRLLLGFRLCLPEVSPKLS
jgi:hypothetical protein